MRNLKNVSVVVKNGCFVICSSFEYESNEYVFESWVKNDFKGYSRYVLFKNGVIDKEKSGLGIEKIVVDDMELCNWFIDSRKGLMNGLSGKGLKNKELNEMGIKEIESKIEELEKRIIGLKDKKEKLLNKNVVEIDCVDKNEIMKEWRVSEKERLLKELDKLGV